MDFALEDVKRWQWALLGVTIGLLLAYAQNEFGEEIPPRTIDPRPPVSTRMSIDTPAREVRFENPTLPEWLPVVRITNLHVAEGSADLLLERHPHDVGVTVLRREGRLRVTVVK